MDVDPKLQRRVQRYGWDLAAADYEPLWQAQLAPAQSSLLERASLVPGEQVLDVACGTGLVALAAARAVAPTGQVVGIDLSGRMVDAAARRAQEQGLSNCRFSRMDAQALALPDAGFDVVLCSLGLMYMPDPVQALREMHRVLRPGGRLVVALWGERSRCAWSALFSIVDDEVASEVCPLFFGLAQRDALARATADAGFAGIDVHRFTTTLDYANAEQACRAAFVGGPIALAWSRMDTEARTRVSRRYLEAIDPWRDRQAYRVPSEVVVASAVAQGGSR